MASPSDQLKVIALVSGGKDSFFSALHCLQNGHRLVALANLFPAPEPVGHANEQGSTSSNDTHIIHPEDVSARLGAGQVNGSSGSRDPTTETSPDVGGPDDADLNSFMYQTVGHQVIPFYAAATGLPLYRQPIRGGAKDEGRDYDAHHAASDIDETESMMPLLRTVMEHHPEVNALCAGAILSTYQRTRVESVALRLGLTPLAYLWKFPVLPPLGPGLPREDAQLLLDMAAAGLDARIIKVASAGLDEEFLWERVSSALGVSKVKKALRRFGAGEGSVLGEGGEFETMVVDGPVALFKKSISVPERRRKVVREGGGTSWLSLQEAQLEVKAVDAESGSFSVRVPGLLDERFQAVTEALSTPFDSQANSGDSSESKVTGRSLPSPGSETKGQDLYLTVSSQEPAGTSIEDETRSLVAKIEAVLNDPARPEPLPTTSITNTIIVLRQMADFPAINAIYGGMFRHPNPPSRVTISCGDLLPEGSNIAIHLTIRPGMRSGDRQGLHVQSRSYWAPANIGPYSQVIDVPLFGTQQAAPGEDAARTRLLSIAGQIPLWPASMIIPPEADITSQIVMSLQHLWRIGVDQKVQLWSSAVAYFPRTPSTTDMQRQGVLAAQAWREAHLFSTGDDDDEDSGPDPWDRRYNSQYMTFGDGGGGGQSGPKLPDWAAVKGSHDSLDHEKDKPVPPFFAVEVEELPRQSGVEWHAHAGFSNLEDSSVEVVGHSSDATFESPFERRVSHFCVAGSPVRSIVSLEMTAEQGAADSSIEDLVAAATRAYADSLGRGADDLSHSVAPYLVYVESREGSAAAPCSLAVGQKEGHAGVVPCRSIWSDQGRRVVAVALYSSLSR